MIERALSLSVPILIGLFTSILGLGDLAAKVQKIFKKIKGKITGAIDGFIEKAGAWFKDKKGRRKEKKDRPSKLETGKKKQEKEDKDKDKDKDKNKSESEDDKEERDDKQKKIAFDKGMKLGAAVVNNENLSNQEIKVELNQLELKYKLKELDAKLMSEKEDLQTWILSGKLDEHKGSKTIERKPTKAESEEEVSEADRKLHEKIAAEVKAQLEAKGKSTEGVETFEEFYGLLQSEAVLLQKKYQPQLRDGIKIAVDLVNSVKQDAKDGDVDVRVRIAPNTTSKTISIIFDKENNIISEFNWKGLGKDENDFPQSHTIERHVGLTDSDLKRRIREDNLMVASTFINYNIANSTVLDIINSNISKIEDWYNNSQRGLLPLKKNTGIIGHYFTKEQLRVSTPASKVTVILNRNDDSQRPFFVLTAFPYERNVEKKLTKKYL